MVGIGEGIRREAGLLLLGGIILGSSSMLKAAERYVPDAGDASVRYYDMFCSEVKSELDKRKNDLRYADMMYKLDCMLENSLFPYGMNCDTTLDYQDEVGDFVTDILKEALENTLKETDMYREVTNELESNVRDLFGLPELPKENSACNDPYHPVAVCTPGTPYETGTATGPSTDRLVGNWFLGYGEMETGVKPTVTKDEVGLKAHVTFNDLSIFGGRFRRGKVQVSSSDNGKLRACLESAISDKISGRFFFDATDADDPRINAGAAISGEMKDGSWVVSGGHDSGSGVYATAVFVKRF